MSKVLVLYYSSYGHIEAMAAVVAKGAREAGAQVDIKRVPELVPDEVARNSHYKVDQAAPVAKVDDLAAYDAIIIGAGTRFGRLSFADGQFPGPGRRSLGARSVTRKSRRGIHRNRHATWWAGNDAILDHHQSLALRHGDRRPRLWPRRSGDP